MAAPGNKPQNLLKTLRELLSYMGRHRLLFLAVALLVTVSASANLVGTYMIRPVVDSLAAGDVGAFLRYVAVTAGIYVAGVAATLGYTQLMVHAAQKVLQEYWQQVSELRRDLAEKTNEANAAVRKVLVDRLLPDIVRVSACANG